ncbi:putative arrestin-related trafficking adapter C2D10.04 [Daldinia childiae]|uniref:putative arrestin-related trafficking adapter C2D10.04 n=1 Tax=Daldinia childiae TaxID=326645 RepID=UPI001447E527|nr:putative arrestin-related trafficking adapter C2D10.04 [Daldinia childiae]KAF3065383.1 putative arrestin-related trafficking adapter C2D10.04 [Daldinia childiae]
MADVSGTDRPEQYAYPVAGNVYYRPRSSERRHRPTPSLPTPHIRPRQRRPQSIHIVSYPAGYTPPDLRPPPFVKSKSSKFRKDRSNRAEANKEDASGYKSSPRRVIERVLGPLKLHFSQYVAVDNPTPPSVSGNSRPAPRPCTPNNLPVRPQSMFVFPSSTTAPSMLGTSAMTAPVQSPMLATRSHASHRNSIISVRSAKSIMSSVTEVPKPVASGSGVSCSIILAEPNVFLTGFEHDGQPRNDAANSTALLRGKLQLNVTKNVKIKSVTLKLHGRARTEWPEGIPPMKVDQFEEESLRTQVLAFFHAAHETGETEFGNQCTYSIRGNAEYAAGRRGASPSQSTISLALKNRPTGHLTARDYKRLSLQSVQSRSFGKGDTPNPNIVQQKTYKVFYPGTYEYSFELPIDHHQLETTKLQFGSVKWELEAIVERAGAFKPNLHGAKEVCIVRVPDQLSLEMTEPISISRQWEDQLHYDIMISGKSFPIGTKIPIAFKLTPLAKVQVHKLKVFVTESVEYWTNDRRVTRKDPGRKILLLEKSAGKPLDKQFEASDVRVLSGGELTPNQRQEARIAAQRRRSIEASRAHTAPQPLPDPTDNLLGDLDLGLEAYWGSTEIEMNVQIPTCAQMAKDKSLRLHPDCSWKNVNVYHWIKIVMRISRLDPEDPAGKRRRHFEISIDSPFTVLNCRATQANTALPEYSGADQPMYRQQASCGCPDAEILATSPSPASSTGTIPSVEAGVSIAGADSPGIVPPPAAHVQQHPAAGSQPVQRQSYMPWAPRPMHLLRCPSFNPPAFDDDEPPPPMPTPPPQYDVVVGTPSVDGLADYFTRLASYDDGDSDSADEAVETPSRLTERSGRVNVPHPRTPGGRMVPSRSLEIQRPAIPMTLNMAGGLLERRG